MYSYNKQINHLYSLNEHESLSLYGVDINVNFVLKRYVNFVLDTLVLLLVLAKSI